LDDMSWTAVTTEPNELGESPFWHPHEQMLYWVDIPGKKILRANVFMGSVEAWPMPFEPGCIAPAQSGGLVIALRDGVYRAQAWGGTLRRVVPAPYDTSRLRFNDGKADPAGRFWAGSYCDQRGDPAAALYALDARAGQPAALTCKVDNATVANGLAWSPDAKTLYWADTALDVIWAWDWNASSNVLSHRRVFHQFGAKPAGWAYGQPGHENYLGRPDGAAVDVEGNYYAAMYEGGCVIKLSPAGQILAKIPTPALCVTMPCLGGDDLKTLYITTARKGRSARELADKPLSGCVFSMRVDVPGLPVNFFLD
jgi:sugar lactone lactonase YvrE